MPHRTILVAVDGTDASMPAIEAAFTVGLDLASHVVGFHIRADSKDAVPLLGEGMSGAMIEEIIDLAEQEAAIKAARAKEMFDRYCRDNAIALVDEPPGPDSVSASWTQETGREDEAMARRGRLADLIVVARPTAEHEIPPTMTLNAALFETGRPVLVAPPIPAFGMGRKIAISWNGSAECARAIGGAMPLIVRADSVVVITAESDRTSASMAPELAKYLAWQGVSAIAEAVVPGGRSIGEALLQACRDDAVDLLVMGAYTNSRLRQLILGGVTKHVLAEAELPVLMGR
ncbi:MAG: universal stress protein [Rhodospirillales bacterium]|nr:universal stress protein [Rhodospirillales bacterium]MDP6805649.1 universal stress protein [Rhodospirillales bacterium]